MLVWDIGSALGCVLLPRICIERIGGEGERGGMVGGTWWERTVLLDAWTTVPPRYDHRYLDIETGGRKVGKAVKEDIIFTKRHYDIIKSSFVQD